MPAGRVAPGTSETILRLLARPGNALTLCYKGLRLIKNEGLKDIDFKVRTFLGQYWSYEYFIKKTALTDGVISRYKSEIDGFAYRPKVSVITPVYNPEPAWIRSAVESVIGQAYGNWELCIADASTDGEVKRLLDEYAEKDARIIVRHLSKNRGISANSNEALSLATGDYVALLDHDDEVGPDALYEVVKYLQSDPQADMVYTDEDKIDLYGKRCEPFFKPGWSPDMLLSCMYTGHLGVYRRKIVEAIGGFREGYDGSQDYDLALRFIERTDRIAHVPKVLYHWRMVPGSTAISIGGKRYAYDAAKKALADYMARNGIKGEVRDGRWVGSYHVKRAIPGEPLVSVIIPTRDRVEMLRKCIGSILVKTTYPRYEVIVVNNGSSKAETHEYFRELNAMQGISVLDYGGDFNFSAINNFAAGRAHGDVLLFLNNDTEVIGGDWMAAMLEHAQRKEVGAVGCKLLFPNRRVQHAGLILGVGEGEQECRVAGNAPQFTPDTNHGYRGRESIILNLSAVTAACMMMRKEVFEELGGFNERLAVAYNDVDLCLRARQKGLLVVYTPYAVLYHHESRSRGREDSEEKKARFLGEVGYMRKKWGALIDAGDPYYNPNLTLEKGDFSINI